MILFSTRSFEKMPFKVAMLYLILLIISVIQVTRTENDQYDYIIVGAGPAGCVLANRLSENGTYQVLLLESGPLPTEMSVLPADSMYSTYTPNFKEYLIDKQLNAGLGLIDQQMATMVAYGLGGGTLINHLEYMRSTKYDYDRWASLGNHGWSYEDVLPYFKKIENTMIKNFDPKQRGTDGPLVVSGIDFKSGSAQAFIEAVKETGNYFTKDYNNGEPYGIGYVQATIKNGRRETAENVYLRPALGRSNLKIITTAHVLKLLVDPETKTAEGVIYRVNHTLTYEAFARKEVIVSAGTLGSAQLLMLSGLGPSEVLEPLGINVIVDSAVGETLHDQTIYPNLVFEVNQSIVADSDEVLFPRHYAEWYVNGTGPLEVPCTVLEADGFIKTPISDPEIEAADVRIIFFGGSYTMDQGTIWRVTQRVSAENYERIWRPLEGRHLFHVGVSLTKPLTHGSVIPASLDPCAGPSIYGDYLSDPENRDVNLLIAGIREVQEIMRAPSFQKYGIRQILTPAIGCEKHVPNSDAFWECHIRHFAQNGWHMVGTCKMGVDRYAVVDNELRFRGAKNLRIADTSVIPFTLTGELAATAYMIGEKAADIILVASHK